MKRCLLLSFLKPDQPVSFEQKLLKDLLLKEFPGWEFQIISSYSQFKKKIVEKKHHLVVMQWETIDFPTFLIESYMQGPYSYAPLVIFHHSIEKKYERFLQEYFITEIALVANPTKADFFHSLIGLMKKLISKETLGVKVRIYQYRIHYLINSGDIEEAQKLVGKIRPHLSEKMKVFYEAYMLKAHGKYEEAIRLIVMDEKRDARLTHLLGSLYFLTKQHEKALASLSAVHKKSPHNPRRLYLIGRCHEELSKDKKEHFVKAVSTFLNLHQLAPGYLDTAGRITQLVIKLQSVDKLPIIEPVLSQLSKREVAQVVKRTEKLDEPFRTYFIDSFVKVLSKMANTMIQNDDHTALKFYRFIEKMLPRIDPGRKQTLEYCKARAYFRFGQLEMAKEINDRVIRQSRNKYEKAKALAVLIEKAMNGEFDVLLDDEKDWLIKKAN